MRIYLEIKYKIYLSIDGKNTWIREHHAQPLSKFKLKFKLLGSVVGRAGSGEVAGIGGIKVKFYFIKLKIL